MDGMTVLVRFALYLDLMLVFGLPLFQLHALRRPERSSPLGKKFVLLTASAAAIGPSAVGGEHAAHDQGDDRGF
ncbi:putative copper export protein [Herbaspirillum rubrisubalbicans]|uniref:hypothetical protein n=1 Tax=Herbaspirillum rubrisubalbicans TaxID=80842 RepID=UPI003F4F5067|nr:putative copper export protein [Herbaspirillum rubrisubalbicans]